MLTRSPRLVRSRRRTSDRRPIAPPNLTGLIEAGDMAAGGVTLHLSGGYRITGLASRIVVTVGGSPVAVIGAQAIDATSLLLLCESSPLAGTDVSIPANDPLIRGAAGGFINAVDFTGL